MLNFKFIIILVVITCFLIFPVITDDINGNLHHKVRLGALRTKVNESLGDPIVDFELNDLNRVYHQGSKKDY